MEEFCTSFNNADHLIVNKIYAAGEEPIEGVNALQIAEGAKRFGHKNAEYIEDKKYVIAHLLRTIQSGDVVMTLGAGDIWETGRDLIKKLPKPYR